MRRLVLMLILFGAPTRVTLAQRALPRFEFRGATLGDTTLPSGLSFSECGGGDVSGELSCMQISQQIGGEEVTTDFSYLDGRLYRVMILYKPEAFKRLVEIFTARYGRPDRVAQRPYHTVGGYSDTNTEYSWRFREGTFAAVRYGSALDGGFAAIQLQSAVAEVARRKAKATREAAARDLGAPTPSRPFD